MSDRQPTELDGVANAVDALQTAIRTFTPGTVVKYNAATQRADVQPSIKCITADGKALTLPQIVECPVAWPRGGGWSMHWNLAPGDTVGILVSDRELDLWMTQGGQVEPRTTRRHELTDAIVLPGLNTDLDPNAAALPTELRLGREDGTATLLIGLDGTVTLEAAVNVKLGSIGATLANARVTDTTAPGASMTAWIAAAQVILAHPAILALAGGAPAPAPPSDFGVIASGSAKVLSD